MIPNYSRSLTPSNSNTFRNHLLRTPTNLTILPIFTSPIQISLTPPCSSPLHSYQYNCHRSSFFLSGPDRRSGPECGFAKRMPYNTSRSSCPAPHPPTIHEPIAILDLSSHNLPQAVRKHHVEPPRRPAPIRPPAGPRESRHRGPTAPLTSDLETPNPTPQT